MCHQLSKKTKKALDQELKRKTTLKNNLFSRYLLFRSSLALFFFVNLYWTFPLIYKPSVYVILPVSLLILIVLACAEQFKLYSLQEVYLRNTERVFKTQIVVQILLLIINIFPQQLSVAIPFFSNNMAAHVFLAVFQFLGLFICWYNLKRIKQIKNNEDKFYNRFYNHIEKYI